MTIGKLLKVLIFFGIIGVGVYFAWTPIQDFWSRINGTNTSGSAEGIAGNMGIAVDQTAAGVTGQTQVGALQRVKGKITGADLSTIRNGIEMYRVDHNGQMPKDLQELTKSGSLGTQQTLRDPWGTEYDSKVVGDTFIIISAGQDKVKGTADDETEEITLGGQSQQTK